MLCCLICLSFSGGTLFVCWEDHETLAILNSVVVDISGSGSSSGGSGGSGGSSSNWLVCGSSKKERVGGRTLWQIRHRMQY